MLPRYKDIVELMKKGSTLEAQEQIMSLREGALELQEENQDLKARIALFETQLKSKEDWSAEKMRYELVGPWKGPAQAYALKKESSDNEAPHLLCTNCFHSTKKTILTPHSKEGWIYMVCPSCKAFVRTGYRGIGGAKYAEDYAEEEV